MAAMITTKNNPFDPREDFPSWHAWDLEQGYNTCSYLDRVANVAIDWPQAVIDVQVEQAIDEIIEQHDGDLYVKLEVQEVAA